MQCLKRERNSLWMRIITLVVIITFLCPNIGFASPKPAKINTLQVNSAFDKDPGNNDTQDEMVAEYHRRSEGRDRDAKVTDYKIYFNPDILEGKIEKIFRMLGKEQIDISDIEPEHLEIIGKDIPDCWPALSNTLGRLIKLPIRSMCGAMALVVFYFLWKNIEEINEGKENKIVGVRGRSTPDMTSHNWVEVKFSGIEGWFVIDLSAFASSYSARGYYIGKQTALYHLRDTSEKFDYGNGITMEDYRIEAIDYKEKVKDSSVARCGEEKAVDSAEEPLIPLKLKDGIVERPAVYEYDEEFWRKVEATNPGTLERVKKVIAIYFDNPEERSSSGMDINAGLKEGVDYDLISGRSVIIRLDSPVEINGVVMKEIVIKGAPFKKKEEGVEYYPTLDPTEENIRRLREESWDIEYDSNGYGKAVPLRFSRKDAIFYDDAKNEYGIGRKGFKDSRCPINILPVMNARYLKDKASDGGELGVVVIASPSKTEYFNDWARNRVADLIGILLSKLQDSHGEPNAEEIKEQIYKHVAAIMGAYGSVLREFHDAGYTHGNPHSGNVVVDMDTYEVHIVDLSEARLKSEMTLRQTFGYQLRDINYATLGFIEEINKPNVSPLVVNFLAHALRCFLINYFGPLGSQFQSDDDLQILEYVDDLDIFLTTKYDPDNHGPKLIYSDDVLRNPLAHFVSRVVFEAGGSREQTQVIPVADQNGSGQAEQAAAEATRLYGFHNYESFNAGIDAICAKYGGKRETIHADLVLYEGKGILVIGQSGIGKSHLCEALRYFGGKYIADNRVALIRIGNTLIGGQDSAFIEHKLDERQFVPIVTIIDMTLGETLRNDNPEARCTILKGEVLGGDTSLPNILSGLGEGIAIRNLVKARMPRSVLNFSSLAEWLVYGISEQGVVVSADLSTDPARRFLSMLARDDEGLDLVSLLDGADGESDGTVQGRAGVEPDIDAPIDTETLLRSLHLSAFCGQKPKKDVVSILADAVDKYRYDRKIIYRAFLDYAEKNNGEPPSWLSVGWIVDRMAQLVHHRSSNDMQLLIKKDLVDEAGNRLWRENEWTKEELQTSGLPNFVINIDPNGITFADDFKKVLSDAFGLDTEKTDSVAQLVSKVVNARQKKCVENVITKPVTMYVVSQSHSAAGDCANNGVGYVNLRVISELVKGIQDDEARLKLLSIYLGIFISHEICGHEMGIDDEKYLTRLDVFYFIEHLLEEIPTASIMPVISYIQDIFKRVIDTQKSLFIEYLYTHQRELIFLSNVGVRNGDNIVTVGLLYNELLPQKIMRIGAHYKGFELVEDFCKRIREAISEVYEKGCEGTGEQICGEFSYGSQFSAGIPEHSVDYVLMMTGVLSDPVPRSDAVSVLKEALRVVKNGGKIIAGTFDAAWILEEDKQKDIIEQVLNLPEYKNKVRLVETEGGIYHLMHYKVYTVEFADEFEKDSSPSVAEIKTWSSDRIIAGEKELVARFGYKGWNLLVAHALSREIGGFSVPDFDIIEIDELWQPFYEANKEVIDEIIRINQAKESFYQAIIEVYKKHTEYEERRQKLEEMLNNELAYLKELMSVSSISDIEERLNRVFYLYKTDFAEFNYRRKEGLEQWFRTLVSKRIAKLNWDVLKTVIPGHKSFVAGKEVIFLRTTATDEDTKDHAKAGKYISDARRYFAVDSFGQLRDLLSADLYKISSRETKFAFILQDKLTGDDLEGGVVFSDINGSTLMELGYSWSEDEDHKKYNPLQEATEGERTVIIRSSNNAVEEVLYNAIKQDAYGLNHVVTTKDGRRHSLMISEEDVLQITRTAKQIEQRLGYPVDIEFGIKKTQIFIVQIRPIVASALQLPQLPVFNKEDIVAEFPLAINAGRIENAKIVFADPNITGHNLRDVQKFLGYNQNFITCLPHGVSPQYMCPYVYGDKLFWIGSCIRRVAHEAINQMEEGRHVVIGYFGDMQELKARFGSMRELKIGDHPAFISEETFDIYSNGDRAVLVKAGTKPITKDTLAKKYVNDFLSTIRAKAQNCKDLDEELVLAIDTDIGNLNLFAQELFSALNQLQDALAREGLDNVRIFIGNGEEIETRLEKYLAEKDDKKDFVISAVVKNKNLALFKGIKDRMQITAVDDTNIENTDTGKLNYIPILPILELSIKKAMGVPMYSNLPDVGQILEQNGMLIIYLLPKANPVPINELKERYRYEAQTLASA